MTNIHGGVESVLYSISDRTVRIYESKRNTSLACPFCRRIIIGISHVDFEPSKPCIICDIQTEDRLTTLSGNYLVNCHRLCISCMIELQTPEKLFLYTISNNQ